MRFIPAVSPVQIQVPLPAQKTALAVFWETSFAFLGLLGQPGPLVKWLRHRPFTAVTRVRVPYGSPIWRRSSAGRALASHARGHRFEFCRLHQAKRTSIWMSFLLFFLFFKAFLRLSKALYGKLASPAAPCYYDCTFRQGGISYEPTRTKSASAGWMSDAGVGRL